MPEYPDRLIPGEGDEIRDEIEDDHFIGRFHIPKDKSAFNSNGEFNSDIIDFYKIPGLSSNLMPPSELDDLKIDILNPDLFEKWEPGKEVPEITNEDFEVNEDKEVYYFQAKDIRVSVPYLFEGEKYIISIDVAHKPLVSNLSHCEFIVPDTRRENPEKNFSSKKDRHNLIAHELKLALEENAISPD